jgi:excisionase family DNA binding protein
MNPTAVAQSHKNEFVSSGTSPTRRGLRIKDAAEYIGSSPWFIEVAIRQRKIPAHKLGRHYVLFKDDLDHYIERVRIGGAA